jgi:hypothetical protein
MSAAPPPRPPGAPGLPAGAAAPARPAGARAVTCPGCGASITLRALGQSVVLSCPTCQSLIDVSRPDIRLIQKFQKEVRRLVLPLGARATLRGQQLEVIGAMGRVAGGYAWEEYLLFSPFLGFRWLVCDQGNWNFGRAIKDSAQLEDKAPVYEGRAYRWVQGGRATVAWVVGEFYWRVKIGDEADTEDYVAVPYLLSREQTDSEVTWTQMVYLELQEVEAAFQVKLPPASEAAVNGPNPFHAALGGLRRPIWIAIGCAVLIQVATMLFARNQSLPVGNYEFDHDPAAEEQVFGPFTLRAGHSLNQLTARADLQNSWVELQCALVNDGTGDVYRFNNAFEFYSGSDSDGAWTEGSRSGATLLTEIPAGTYHLVVDGSGGGQGGKPLHDPVALVLHHDVTPWRNFWLALALILAFPAWLFFRALRFEQQRWDDDGSALQALAARLRQGGRKP